MLSRLSTRCLGRLRGLGYATMPAHTDTFNRLRTEDSNGNPLYVTASISYQRVPGDDTQPLRIEGEQLRGYSEQAIKNLSLVIPPQENTVARLLEMQKKIQDEVSALGLRMGSIDLQEITPYEEDV